MTDNSRKRRSMSAREAGDRTQAEALRIAEDWLKRQGWGFTPHDVGKRAKEIIDGLATHPRDEETRNE